MGFRKWGSGLKFDCGLRAGGLASCVRARRFYNGVANLGFLRVVKN